MYTILLIDDDRKIMKLNKDALQWYKYDVMEAYTLSEADARLNEKIPDLIVLDVNLPDGSGLDYCKKLKDRYRLPVILISGEGTDLDVLTGLNAGADDYIVKPYDLGVFIARIEARISRSKSNIQ